MRTVFAAILLCGCAAPIGDPPSNDPPDLDPAPLCRMPQVGAAPRTCETSDDCFWSPCSSSTCTDGACVHRDVGDGAACFVHENLNVGFCTSCICTIDT